jgi:hypothetical protein
MMASDRDDVLSIIGPPWPGDARVVKAMRDFPPGASEPAGAYVVRVLHEARRAAELDAATPPEGAAQGREDAVNARMYQALRSIRYNANFGHQDRPLHVRMGLIAAEAEQAIATADAALATQPTPAGGST